MLGSLCFWDHKHFTQLQPGQCCPLQGGWAATREHGFMIAACRRCSCDHGVLVLLPRRPPLPPCRAQPCLR